MKKPKNSPDRKSIGALSSTALLAFLLQACAGGAGNLKGAESLKGSDDIQAFIAAAAARNDVDAVMKGIRMKHAIDSGLKPDAYPYNGLQDDETVIECAESGIDAGRAGDKAAAKARRVFMEAFRNPKVRVLVEKMVGGTLKTKLVSGDASGINAPAPYVPRMANGRYVRCAHARNREKK
ncbi:hypothetical protein JW752_03840 [Candidatus Peregrinibacteria bacterium]|nr:hypothetical protein [Candidatus Peregrinibacteria bacterium]